MNRSERPMVVALAVAAVVLLLAGGWSMASPARPPIARVVTAKSAPVVPPPVVCLGYVALTFDDGPKPLSPQLLRLLDERDVPAAFFYEGRNVAKHPEMVRAAAQAGHQIGNHTWDHPDLRTLSPAEVADQLRHTNDVLTPITGPVSLFRSPFGNSSEAIRDVAKQQGLAEVLWTVDTKDFQAASAKQVLDRSAGMTDGGVLLMHDGNEHTIAALPQIINAYHERGMCFGRLAPTDTPQILPWLPELPFAFRAGARPELAGAPAPHRSPAEVAPSARFPSAK